MFDFFAKRMRSERKRGFTLVELVIVVLILGILVGIAAIAFSDVTASSKDTVAKANLKTIKSAIQMYVIENGTLPKKGTTDAFENVRKYMDADTDKNPAGYTYDMVESTNKVTIKVTNGNATPPAEVATYDITVK